MPGARRDPTPASPRRGALFVLAFALPIGSAKAAAGHRDDVANARTMQGTEADRPLPMTIAEPIAIRRPQRAPGAALALADGVELIGEYEGSGFKEPPQLARRADGQMIQLSRLLYLVAAACDGQRDAEAVATVVTEHFGRRVSPGNVRHIVDRKLRPLGVLALADGTTPALPKREPVMALRHRKPIVAERYVNGVARAFVWLHRPRVQIVLLALLAAFDLWLFGVHGIAGGLRAVLYSPVLLLGLLASIVVATGFHELGHASACRYGGARPGVMGVGIYLVWPAFYCDVTEAYRLNRPARLRTDLGGVYFNGVFALLAGLAYFATGQEAFLLAAFVQHTIVLQQLLPLLRFDGYYVLSDLTGVPDILSRVKPILRSLVPRGTPEPRVQELKPWVRVVVTAYLVVLIPTLLFMIASTVVAAPRMAATAFDSLGLQLDRLGTAHATPELILGIVQIGALLLPLGAIAVSISRSGRMAARAVASWSRGSALRRAVAIAAGAALVAGLAYTWWPNGDYEPIRPGERGTIGDALRGLQAIPGDRPSFTMQRAALFGSAPTVPQQTAARPQDAARHPSATTTAHTPPPAVAPGSGDAPASEPGKHGSGPTPAREPGAVTRPPARHPATSPSSGGQAAPTPTTAAATGPSSPAAATPAGVTSTAPPTVSAPPTDVTSPPSSQPTDVTSPPRTESGGDATNTAVAVNTIDGARIVRIAFDLAWLDGSTVDPTNAAIAVASCTSCTTVAIAIQAVLVFGQPRVFMPTNVAVALNEACTDCQTLASAYQDIIQLAAPAHLSAAGRQQVEAIRQALAALAESGLPIAEIQRHVEALHHDLAATLGSELLPDDPSASSQAPTPSGEPTDVAPSGAPTPDPTSPADAPASPPAAEDPGTEPAAIAPEAAPADDAPAAVGGDATADAPAGNPDLSAGSADPAVPAGTADPAVPAGTADPAVPAGTADPAPAAGNGVVTAPTPAGSAAPPSPAPAPASTQAPAPASPTPPPATTTASPPAAEATPPASSTATTTDPTAPAAPAPPTTTMTTTTP